MSNPAISEAPSWLLDLAKGKKNCFSVSPPRERNSETPDQLPPVPDGIRNDTLTRQVGRWFHKGLDLHEVFLLAVAWNRASCDPPLDHDVIVRTVESIRQREESGQPAPLKCLDLRTFMTLDLPPREYILPPIIPFQGLCMLYGPRGLGKTHAGLSLGYAVATGTSLWGFEAPLPRRVLFVDGEMPAGAIQERLALLIASGEIEPESDHLLIITPDIQEDPMPNLAHERGQKSILPFIHAADLIILDNLATLTPSARENESGSWLPVQQWLLELRRQGKSVLLIHHSGKSGQQRGTSAREDILDTVIALRKPEDYCPSQGARFHVHFEKARGVCGDELKPFEAQLVTRGQGVAWVTRELKNPYLEQIQELREGGKSFRKIAKELDLSPSKVFRLMNEGGKDG